MNTFLAKRVFDFSIALVLLIVAFPILLIAAVGIKLTSRGPVLYRAGRIGRDRRRTQRPAPYQGREFTMYKLRTMRVDAEPHGPPVTAWDDDRIFPWGRLLRVTKIDELPQLVNVVKGDMSLVGPRPEALEIVRTHYSDSDIDTVRVRPGITSPGTLYYYTHCEQLLSGDGVMNDYLNRVLPLKLALDRFYLANMSLRYDVRVLLRTAYVIIGRFTGLRQFPDPPELHEAMVKSRP